MSARIVHINALSFEVVFQGCLTKAPPLNRRGRKKWHQRYFILRANRTFECYRSKKSADSKKGPRRTIDLRECINLEVGLEYKQYKYVICLGTFKRIFFFASPSDPMMLQWSDVLEKVKNCRDGDSIEVLDISLRKIRGVPVVLSVNSSVVSRGYSGSRKNKISTTGKRTKSAMALSHFSGISTDTVDLRMVLNSPSKDSSLLSPVTPNSTFSLRSSGEVSVSEDDPQCFYRSISSDYSSFHSSIATSGSMTLSPSRGHTGTDDGTIAGHVSTGLSHSNTIGGRARSGAIVIPNRVPPPRGFVQNPTRDKSVYFVGSSGKQVDQDSHTSSELSSTEDDRSAANKRERFAPKDGSLNGEKMKKKQSVKTKDMSSSKQDQVADGHITGAKEEEELHSNVGNTTFLKTNVMKRSVRYRKITLREPEKPLHVGRSESDSEDEESSDIGLPSSSLVPGPRASISSNSKAEIFSDTSHGNESAEEEENGSGAKDENDAFTLSSSCPNLLLSPRLTHQPASELFSPPPQPQHSQANSYSRVTIVGTRDGGGMEQGFQPMHKKCKSKSKSIALFLKKKPSLDEREEESEQLGKRDDRNQFAIFQSPDKITSPSIEPELVLSPSVLPAPSNEVLTDVSQNSLDEILVEPPEMFGAGMQTAIVNPIDLDSPYLKRKLSRTRNMGGTASKSSKPNDKITTLLDLAKRKSGPSINGRSIQDQHPKISGGFTDPSTDRNSTESNDTGYTSSTSPGYQNQVSSKQQQNQQQQPSSHDFNNGIPQDGRSTPIPEEDLLRSAEVGGPLKPCSSHHSLASSSSSDLARFYIPFVFHSKGVAGSNANVVKGSNKFCIQVCLVESSEELIKDLISLKRVEGFSLVEAEEVSDGEGSLITSHMDDFTVETSLEDLEFGFSVTSSTQQDTFMRKVRQFTFEIKNLFGSSKMFSCDVEIRYADQLTILSVEVM